MNSWPSQADVVSTLTVISPVKFQKLRRPENITKSLVHVYGGKKIELPLEEEHVKGFPGALRLPHNDSQQLKLE